MKLGFGLTEFQPVTGIPPVSVELAVCEARELREGTQYILEDDEKREQEGDHEGPEQAPNCFRENQTEVQSALRVVQRRGRFVKHGQNEFFCRNDHQKYTAEDGERFVEYFQRPDMGDSWVLEFVAECGAEDEVDPVGEVEVFGVGDVAERGGELEGEVLAELA